MWYNYLENVPAARMAAKRPSLVTWCCGQIATLGGNTSSRIEPQVNFLSPSLARHLHQDISFCIQQLVNTFLQFRRSNHLICFSHRVVDNYVSDLSQIRATRADKSATHSGRIEISSCRASHLGQESALQLFPLYILVKHQRCQTQNRQASFQQHQGNSTRHVSRIWQLSLLMQGLFVTSERSDPQAPRKYLSKNSKLDTFRQIVSMEFLASRHAKDASNFSQAFRQLFHVRHRDQSAAIPVSPLSCLLQHRSSRPVHRTKPFIHPSHSSFAASFPCHQANTPVIIQAGSRNVSQTHLVSIPKWYDYKSSGLRYYSRQYRKLVRN